VVLPEPGGPEIHATVRPGVPSRRANSRSRFAIEPITGRVVFANPALRKLLGLQPSAAVAGRALADFLHPDERLEVAKAAAGAATAGPAGVRLATRMRRADGSTAEVEGAATLPGVLSAEILANVEGQLNGVARLSPTLSQIFPAQLHRPGVAGHVALAHASG